MSRGTFAPLLSLALFAGCQSRLNDSRTIDIVAGDTVTTVIDAPKYDQLVTVTVASDHPVHVAVYLKKDEVALQPVLNSGKASDLVLASKKGVTNDTLEARIPAKQEFVIRFDATTGKATRVQVTTKGK